MAPFYELYDDLAWNREDAMYEAVKDKLFNEDLHYEIARFVTKHRQGGTPIEFFLPGKEVSTSITASNIPMVNPPSSDSLSLDSSASPKRSSSLGSAPLVCQLTTTTVVTQASSRAPCHSTWPN